MKFGLFLGLLVLLASTNIFGEKQIKTIKEDRPSRFETVDEVQDKDKPVTTIKEETQPVKVVRQGPRHKTIIREETRPTEVVVEEKRPTEVVLKEKRPTEVVVEEKRPTEAVREDKRPVEVLHEETTPVPEVHEDVKPVDTGIERQPDSHIKLQPGADILEVKPNKEVPESHVGELPTGENIKTDDKKPLVQVPVTEVKPITENSVHVSGNIVLVKHHASYINPVQYDLDGSRFTNGVHPLFEPQSLFAQDFIARQSRVTLYVSTTKTLDRKLAFGEFPIKYKQDHFPLTFDIDVDLPNQQRGLLERADITLYFFVYITNFETHIDTFLPAGTSQILLQGTNRLVQKLDIFVRASGIEVVGLFRGRFGERYIRPGTSFQVFYCSGIKFINSSSFNI